MKRKYRIVIEMVVCASVFAFAIWQGMQAYDRRQGSNWVAHMHETLQHRDVMWNSRPPVRVACDAIYAPFLNYQSDGQGFWAQWMQVSRMMLDTHPADHKLDLCVGHALLELHLDFMKHAPDEFSAPKSARDLHEDVWLRGREIDGLFRTVFGPEPSKE